MIIKYDRFSSNCGHYIFFIESLSVTNYVFTVGFRTHAVPNTNNTPIIWSNHCDVGHLLQFLFVTLNT